MQRTNDTETARENLYGKYWMSFGAWDGGDCAFWLDENGETAAYVRFDDHDANGIAFMEVRDQGNGYGSAIIAELRAERPGLYISGDIDNANCARFWDRNGFDVNGATLSNGKVWNA